MVASSFFLSVILNMHCKQGAVACFEEVDSCCEVVTVSDDWKALLDLTAACHQQRIVCVLPWKVMFVILWTFSRCDGMEVSDPCYRALFMRRHR